MSRVPSVAAYSARLDGWGPFRERMPSSCSSGGLDLDLDLDLATIPHQCLPLPASRWGPRLCGKGWACSQGSPAGFSPPWSPLPRCRRVIACSPGPDLNRIWCCSGTGGFPWWPPSHRSISSCSWPPRRRGTGWGASRDRAHFSQYMLMGPCPRRNVFTIGWPFWVLFAIPAVASVGSSYCLWRRRHKADPRPMAKPAGWPGSSRITPPSLRSGFTSVGRSSPASGLSKSVPRLLRSLQPKRSILRWRRISEA